MTDASDWRLENAPEELKGAALRRLKFVQPSPTWHHDHCVLCRQKIAEPGIEDAVHEGYLVVGDDDWVCPDCFADFAEHFGWTVEKRHLILVKSSKG